MSTLGRGLAAAKRRATRRRREGGAVMFVIAITLALLAAMGVYALNVSATEVKSAGYIRQQTQTHYLAEYGILAGAQDVSANRTQMYYTALTTPYTSGQLSSDTNCISLYGEVSPGASTLALGCRRVGSAELSLSWTATATTPTPQLPMITPWTADNSELARGTSGLPTSPDFFIEVTDANQKNPPSGYSTNQNLCFAEFTVSAYGLTPSTDSAPGGPGTKWSGGGVNYGYQSEGLELARARIVGGPITCPSPGG
jgi:hypothetical protein